MFAPLNVLVFFALTLPWFLALNHQCPGFAYYGIVEESLHRYTTTQFHRTGPLYFYIPWIVIGLFTWSTLLPESVVTAPGVYRGLCTNYQVTAEVATKAAVRIEETRQPNNRPNIYKAVVESYGILPAE